VRLIPPRADPPGSGFSNTNFSLLPCPENPENTANGSGKILESDSAQLRRFERVTIVVSGPYTNVGSNHPPSRVPAHLAPGVDEAFRLLHARHVTTAIVSIRWDFIVQWFAKRLDMVQAGAQWCSIAIWPKQRDLFVKACPFRAESPGACARLPRRERRAPTACSSI